MKCLSKNNERVGMRDNMRAAGIDSSQTLKNHFSSSFKHLLITKEFCVIQLLPKLKNENFC